MTDTNGKDAADQAVADLERELGLPKGFFNGLVHEDDWSFVIKLHALFESALAFVVAHKLGEKVAGIIGRLDMNGQRGKVAFARALEIVGDDEVRFLALLSSLRNRCVHGVRQTVEFSLPGYVEALSRDERKSFLRAVRGDEPDRRITIGDKTVSHTQFVLENPKLSIWLSSMWLLAALYMLKEIEDHVRRRERALIELATLKTPPAPNPLLIALSGKAGDSGGLMGFAAPDGDKG
ncbi:hypothetical protein [Paraburkholderia phenoliruptrix]|uniref:hypothetical protein n=1 Tax=Paraburkholderia phenoliruptrix TaxID=252970 RepID=UPI0028698740|nr:hypothetical protein [Paraburkholderia phenoliruptrix]WMY09680.1 hypothetical protein P3F88_07935 [Paraburkholderia phenoliruptrix]